MFFNGSQTIPGDVMQRLSAYAIVGDIPSGDNLPAGASVSIDLEGRKGIVSGTFAAGMSYYATFEFLDARQCTVVRLLVTLSTGRTSEPEQVARACTSISAVQESSVFLFLGTRMAEISATIVVGYTEERVTPFQVCDAAGMKLRLQAAATAGAAGADPLPFARWEKLNAATGAWEAVSTEAVIVVVLEPDAQYRAVYAQKGFTFTPGTRVTQACMEVSSVLMYQRIPLVTAAVPEFATDPLTAPIGVGRDTPQDTPFRLCGTSGATYILQAASEYWTREQVKLVFWKWQRYNAATKTWDDILIQLTSETQPTNVLSVILENGAQLRAVYRQAIQLR
jgi:hypothetical protein